MRISGYPMNALKICVVLACFLVAACASITSSPTQNGAKRYADNVCIVTKNSGSNIIVMMKKGMLVKSKPHLFDVEITALSEPGAAYIEHGDKFFSTVFAHDDVWFAQKPLTGLQVMFGQERYELNQYKQGSVEIETAKKAYNECLKLPISPEKAATNLGGNMVRTDNWQFFYNPDGQEQITK